MMAYTKHAKLKMKRKPLYTVLTVFSIMASITCITCHAETHFYKWVDSKGTTHYTQTPPPKSARKIKKVATYNDVPSSTVNVAATATQNTNTTQPTQTTQTLQNNQMPANNPQQLVVPYSNSTHASISPANNITTNNTTINNTANSSSISRSAIKDSSSNNPLQPLAPNNNTIQLPPQQPDPTRGQPMPQMNR